MVTLNNNWPKLDHFSAESKIACKTLSEIVENWKKEKPIYKKKWTLKRNKNLAFKLGSSIVKLIRNCFNNFGFSLSVNEMKTSISTNDFWKTKKNVRHVRNIFQWNGYGEFLVFLRNRCGWATWWSALQTSHQLRWTVFANYCLCTFLMCELFAYK